MVQTFQLILAPFPRDNLCNVCLHNKLCILSHKADFPVVVVVVLVPSADIGSAILAAMKKSTKGTMNFMFMVFFHED